MIHWFIDSLIHLLIDSLTDHHSPLKETNEPMDQWINESMSQKGSIHHDRLHIHKLANAKFAEFPSVARVLDAPERHTRI